MDVENEKHITCNVKKGVVLDTSLPKKKKRCSFQIPIVRPKRVKREINYKKTMKDDIPASEHDTLTTVDDANEPKIPRNMKKIIQIINTQGREENSIIMHTISKNNKNISKPTTKKEKSHLNLISNKILESLDKTFFYEENDGMLNDSSAQCRKASNNTELVDIAPSTLIEIQNITDSKEIQIKEESASGNVTLKEPNQEKYNIPLKRNEDDSYKAVITKMNMSSLKGEILEQVEKEENTIVLNTNVNIKHCETNIEKETEKIQHKNEADVFNITDNDIMKHINPDEEKNTINNLLTTKNNLENYLMKNTADSQTSKDTNIRSEDTDFEINECNELQNLNKSCTNKNLQVEHILESQIPIPVDGNKNIKYTEIAHNGYASEFIDTQRKNFTKTVLNYSGNMLLDHNTTSNSEGQIKKLDLKTCINYTEKELEEKSKSDIDFNTKIIYNKHDYQQSILQNTVTVQNIPIQKTNKLKPEFNNFNTINILNKNLEAKKKKFSLFYTNALDYSKILERKEAESLNENQKNPSIESYIKCFKDSADIKRNSKCISTLENPQDISNFYENGNNLNKIHNKCNDLCSLQEQHDTSLLNTLEMQQNIPKETGDLKILCKYADPLIYDRHTMKSKNDGQFQITEEKFSIKYEITDNYTNGCNIQIDKIENTKITQNKEESPPKTSDEILINNSQQLTKNKVNTEKEKSNEQLNKHFQDAEKKMTFLITARDCFKTEVMKNNPPIEKACHLNANENTIEIGKDEEITKEKDTTHIHDSEDNFDLDDDFTLTASQLSMIGLNETNQILNEKKNSSQQTENCTSTHFGFDSITVEIIDQLCYIRETVDSIKGLLQTSQKKQ